jgi:selenocysteine lyase/cysteine desulfurase
LDSEQPYSLAISIVDLLPLITARTRLVAITSCSNILGSLVSVADITKQIREQATKLGAKKIEVVVDCVAYASHRQIDVRAWDVDYAFFSYYKVPISLC